MVRLRAVFIDVGGPLYDDNNFLVAVSRAVQEMSEALCLGSPDFSDIRGAFDEARNTEGMSIRKTMARRFLGSEDLAVDLHLVTKKHWVHPEGSLYPDASDFLRQIKGVVPVAVVANQEKTAKEALIRDGMGDLIDVWGISAMVGFEKPSADLFQWALDQFGITAPEALHIGNRFDTDVEPARKMGMKTAWLLRGEAPDEPLAEQLALADYVLESLAGFSHIVIPLATDRTSDA